MSFIFVTNSKAQNTRSASGKIVARNLPFEEDVIQYERYNGEPGTPERSNFVITRKLENGEYKVIKQYRYDTPNRIKAVYTESLDTIKNGYYKEFNKLGYVVKIGVYKDGKMDGIWKFYLEDETTYYMMTYANGKAEGPAVSYKNGKRWHEWQMKNDKPIGLCPYFKPYSKAWSEHWYEKGKIEKVGKEYDEDGQLQSKRSYQNDSLHDLAEYFYEKEKLMGKGSYVHGKKRDYGLGTIKLDPLQVRSIMKKGK